MSTRPISSVVSDCAMADSTQPTVNRPSDSSRAFLRDQRPVASIISGAISAEAKAYAVIAWPAAATLTPSACETGTRMPVSTKAPVPMARLVRVNR
jgi:hypothetical protein